MAQRYSDRAHIVITEKKPHCEVHSVSFKTFAHAKKAYKKAEAFWKDNLGNAVQVESEEKIVTVSGDIVASVTLHKENKIAKPRNRA